MSRRSAVATVGIAVLPVTMGQVVAAKSGGQAPVFTAQVGRVYDHAREDYTQGLVYENGVFFEGTGQHGHSRIRKYRFVNGKREVLQSVDLPAQHFGEGIALLKGKVVQLTWQSQKGFIYQASDLKRVGEFTYPGEGWGLTTDGRDFYMSDGTATIRVVDGDRLLNHQQYVVKRVFQVADKGTPIPKLNELEMIHGELYANVWQTDRIAVISPKTGKVLRWIDCSNLISPMFRREMDSVLNGIAYDAEGRRLFLTGKLWSSLFEVREVAPRK